MADQDSNNHRPRRYCDPHDGSRTHYWRVFERNFRVGASADFMREDEHSIWSVIDDTHQMTIAGKIIEYIAKVPRSRAIDTSNTNAVVQFLTDIGFLQNNDLINA